jgi:hypothetical protein
MNERELDSTFVQGQDAFLSGEFDRAKALLLQVKEQAPVVSHLVEQADRYLHHLQHRDLLAQIASEPGADRKLDLIEQAEKLNLDFVVIDNREVQLAEIKAAAQAQLKVIADDQAQAALADGDSALKQWKWDEAETVYKRARDRSVSGAVREQAENRLKALSRQRGQFAEAERLLAEIPRLLAQADVPTAERTLGTVQDLVAGHPDLEDAQRQVAVARRTLTNINQALEKGNEELRDGEPKAAEAEFTTAKELAQEIGWPDWVRQGEQRLEKALQEIAALTSQMHECQRTGESLYEQACRDATTDPKRTGDLAAGAVEALKEADKLATKLELPVEDRQAISALLEQADRLDRKCKAITSAQAYLDEADFENAHKQLLEAEKLAGRDKLDDLIRRFKEEAVKRQRTAESLKRTLEQRQTPYRSPAELGRARDEYVSLFPPVEANERWNEAQRLYWLQAAADLRERTQGAMEKLEHGHLAYLLEEVRDAHKEWKEYYGPKEEERRRDPGTWSENRTLAARLAILDEQIRHLKAAEPAARQFEEYLASVEQSGSGDGLDIRLVQQGQEMWKWLQEEVPFVQRHLLRGYTRHLAGIVIAPLRRQAQNLETTLATALDQASSRLNTSQLGEALDLLNRHKPQRDELQRLDNFYAEISQADGSGSWTIQSRWETWDGLHQAVEEAIRHADWLVESREKMAVGAYETALGLLDRILGEVETHAEASKEKELATQSGNLQKEANQAQARANYTLEIEKLEAVQQLDSRAKWMIARLSTARTLLRQQEEFDRILETAQKHLNNHAYDLVKQNLGKLEEKEEKLTPEQAKRAEEIRSQADIQVTQAANVRNWLQAAREALKQCELEQALTLAQQVLDVRPDDAAATQLQGWAVQVRQNLENARDLLAKADYPGAETTLLTAKRIGPGVSGPEIEQLLNEARRLRSQNQAASESLRQAEGAKKIGDWVKVLQLVMPALEKLGDNPEHLKERNGLEGLRDEAVPSLQKIIKDTVSKTDPNQEEINSAQAALQALQNYPDYLDETSRQAHDTLLIAHKILQARGLLEKHQVAEAVALLEPYKLEHSSEQFLAAYNAARFANALLEARQLTPEQSSSIQNHQQAIESLTLAQHLQSKLKGTIEIYRASYWIGLAILGDSAKTISSWLSDLTDRKTRLMIRKAINSGRLNDVTSDDGSLQPGAKTLLSTLNQSPAKETLSREIESIEQKMTEAANWKQTPDKTRSVVTDCLKPLLPPQRDPAYPPAQTLLTQIWDTLRTEATDLASDADNVTSLAQAVDTYDLLIELEPPDLATMQGTRREVKRALDNKLDDIADRVQSALIDADLEKTDYESLLREVRGIPSSHLDKRSSLKTAEEDLSKRLQEIGKVNTHVLKARQGLENPLTHCQGSYQQDVLDHLSNAELVNPDIFVSRREISQLGRQTGEHIARRHRIESEIKPQYEAIGTMLKEGRPLHPGVEPAEKAIWRQFERKYGVSEAPTLREEATAISAVVQWGQQWFEEAQEINRKWQREDPENQYCLRRSFQAPDEQDPLKDDCDAFDEQKTQLGQIGQDISNALELTKQANELDKQASGEREKATNDSMFALAIDQWDQAGSLYDEALRRLAHVSKRNAWETKLIEAQNSLKGRLAAEKTGIQAKREETAELLSKLQEARREAREQEAICGRRDIDCMKLAIVAWSNVLALNPKDLEAKEHIEQLRVDIEAALRGQRWRRIMGVSITLVAILAAVWAFLYFGQIGPYTPIPTLTATLAPTATPLPTVTATFPATATPLSESVPTPTIVATFAEATVASPVPAPGPATCLVARRGWMRAKASNTSLGLNIFEQGIEVLVFDKVATESEGEWYRIETTFGEPGFFQADLLTCPEAE